MTTLAGEPVMRRPHAAWVALLRQCARGGRVALGFANRAALAMACPKDLPEAPVAIRLPADTLQRLHLLSRPLRASTSAAAH